MIATAMVFIQNSKAQDIKVEAFRQLLARKVETKTEPVMSKFGAIIATGIIDASGRNATLSLRSSSGHKNLSAIVGVALFLQYWYWYPLIHFISLSFTPTAVIGVTKDLKIPKWKFKSNAKPSLFAYPEKVKPPEKKKQEKVSTAILSTTKKAAEREKKKQERKDSGVGNSMSISTKDLPKTEETNKPAEPKQEKKPEPKEEILQNPVRVTPIQLEFISYDADDRYFPIHQANSSKPFGIVILRDTKPSLPQEFVEGKPNSDDEENEPKPPAAFEYVEN